MNKFKIGDTVYAKLGTLPVAGTIVCQDAKTGKYLIRFSAMQQDWYSEDEIAPYSQD